MIVLAFLGVIALSFLIGLFIAALNIVLAHRGLHETVEEQKAAITSLTNEVRELTNRGNRERRRHETLQEKFKQVHVQSLTTRNPKALQMWLIDFFKRHSENVPA